MNLIQFTQKQYNVPYQRYIHLQSKLRQHRKEIFILLEHPPTITGGNKAKKENLLAEESFLKNNGIQLHTITRGGDYTAHEPGQLVVYPHIDLQKRNIDITNFLNFFFSSIQKAILDTWDLATYTNKEKPGLYLTEDGRQKLVSIGLQFQSFFTSFGAAINISNSLSTFQYINPCGVHSSNITSIKKLGLDTSKENLFIENFIQQFSMQLSFIF